MGGAARTGDARATHPNRANGDPRIIPSSCWESTPRSCYGLPVRTLAAAFVAVPLLLTTPSARATDTWTSVRPGIDWLHRTTDGGVPQDIHAVRVDLSQGQVGLRASMDAPGTERGVGTDTFAESVGALVAIGGDWSDGYTPVGLAIGNGFAWHDHYSDPNIGGTWGSFGCDVWNGCTIEALPPLPDIWWYAPTIAPWRYYNAVGANGLLMLDDGVPLSGCYDGCSGDTCRHPRSMVCLEQGGGHLWFIAVDGRRAGASGMTCGEARDLAADLGCWDAAMLDGGGSTSIWIDGSIRNQPSDGGPRDLANHVGVIYADAPDATCPFDAGAWCEGSRLRTCSGSHLVNDGDCAAFGTACQEDGDWAFCVNPSCPGGDGMGTGCVDDVTLESCTDGVYSSGSCAAFGLVCGTDALGSGCMDPACAAGPSSGFCADVDRVGSCSDGVYSEEVCAGDWICWNGPAGPACMDPRCAEGPDGSFCVDPETVAGCTAGTYEEIRCDLGQRCEDQEDGAACVDEGGDDDDSASAGDDDDAWDDDDLAPPTGDFGASEGGCGCSASALPTGSRAPAGLLVLAIVGRRLRRSHPCD